MHKGLFEESSPFTQFIMLLFAMATCFLLTLFVGMLLAPLILGISPGELMNTVSAAPAEQNLNLLRYMQILQHAGLFIIPAFFAAYLFSGHITGYLSLNVTAFERRTLNKKSPKPAAWFGAVLLIMLTSIPLINLLASLNEMIVFPEILAGLEQWLKLSEETNRQLLKLFLDVDHVGGMLFNIFMIAVLAALGEELIFRGVIQKIFAKWTGNIHAAIILSGFLFSLMHMQFYGFFPRWLLGVMFGYLLAWSGTMWLPVFAHFVQNAVAVFLSYLIHQGTIPETMEEIGANWSEIPVTIAATAICVWLFLRIRNDQCTITQPDLPDVIS